MSSRFLTAPFSHLIQALLLLILLFVLPFIEILGAWFYWGWFLFLGATFFLGFWILPHASRNWRIPWPPVVLGVWVLFEVLRAPEWDRSFGLLMVWGCALVLGLVAYEVSRRVPQFPWVFCLLFWGLSTAIAVLNPLWSVPVEVMEESIQSEMLEEGYKQAILHAASQSRFHFPFGNPIDLGVFLSLWLLSTPALLDKARRSLSARIFVMGVLVSAGVQTYILWGTRSRTSLVGLAGGLCVWLAWKGRGGVRAAGAAILLIFIGGVCLCLSPTGREMLSRTETVHARLIFWEAGLRMARESPLIGLGIGGYGSNYPRFRDLTAHQTIFAHNLLIEAMVDMGAVGLGLLLVVLFQFIRRRGGCFPGSGEFIRQACGDQGRINSPLRESDLLDIWGASALACFFISTLLGFHQNMLYLIGYVAVIVGMSNSRGGGISTLGASGSRPLNSLLRPCLVVTVLIVVAIPCAFREAGKSYFEQAATIFQTQRDAIETKRLLNRATSLWPPLAEAHSYLGELLKDMGDLPASERSLREAIRWSPTAGFLHDDLAELLARMGRKQEALQEVDKAIALHPVKYTYHLHRSRLLYDLGQTAEAARAKAQGESLEQFEPRYEEARKAQAVQSRG
jgi:O-antigen ligase